MMRGLDRALFVSIVVRHAFGFSFVDFRERYQNTFKEHEHPDHALKTASVVGGKPAWNDRMHTLDADIAPVLSSDFGLPYVNWSMCNVTYHSNLAGMGPDEGEQSLRYYKVASAGGQSIDLVVTTNSGYRPKDNMANGLVSMDSCFGVINVKGSSSVELIFSWYLSGTNKSVAFDRSYFTVYDIDRSKKAKEFTTFYNRVNEVFYDENHSMEVSGALESGLTFKSSDFGTGADNPKHPMNLTNEQLTRAVMVDFIKKTQWKITFGVEGGRRGRNFVFAGLSNLPRAPTTPSPRDMSTTMRVRSTTTSSTLTTTCEPRSCQVFADPHVSGFDSTDNEGPAYLALLGTNGAGKSDYRVHAQTFDGRPMDVTSYDVGDFWLVKHDLVHIQGRFRYSGDFIPDKAAVGAVAVGGPFLDGGVFIAEPLDGQMTFNGVPVPNGDWVDDAHLVRVHQDGADGAVEVDFPMGVQLALIRLGRHIDLKITMPKLPGSVDGECGNFDGIPENDDEVAITARMGARTIEHSMLLFANADDVD